MKNSLHRRISVATCWAANRVSVLDGFERYEDSYAITQEFREWITCIEEHQGLFEASVLSAPNDFPTTGIEEKSDLDEKLEI